MRTRVLIVEDVEKDLALLQALVRQCVPDAEIRALHEGLPALVSARESSADLILLKAALPDMDGMAVCRRIKSDPATADIPVLIISDGPGEMPGIDPKTAGKPDGCIRKPINPAELTARLNALLGAPERKTAEEDREFRIMVVDDSRTSRNIVISELRNNPDFKIADFENVQSALAALDAFKPHFIISDVNMPNMDGHEFCSCIRHHPDYKHVPFVLQSSTIDDETRMKALQHGVTEAFPKPFKRFELFKYVSRYVDAIRGSFEHDVLIVDDTRAIRAILKKHLTDLRLRVYEAANTEQADKTLEQYPVDLVILDNTMPGKTGVEWCKELRASEEYKWLPILGLSSSRDLALSFIHAGADDYLSKDLIKEEIGIRVNNLLKRVSLTKQLNEAVDRERALNKQKNKLMGTAAHDIRNPISVISGYAELILEGGLTGDEETVRESIKTIHDISRQALEMLNDILDVSCIESGVIEMKKETLRLADLLAERVAFMNEIGRKKNITGTFINRLDKDCKPLVEGDKKRLIQIVDNIMSNAIKYSQPNTTFTVSLDRQVEGWLIQVADNGQGIPKAELAGVFDEFKKTSVQATGGEKSTGLGLAIVKKLVEMHGGTVWMDSEVGKGTTVSFVLPMCRTVSGIELPPA